MNLDELIEYESENTSLDFKAEEYGKNSFELIKDVMSMANSHTNGKKYIIVGVKDNPNEDREIIGLKTISDQAILENIIQENIEPIIHFKYYKYEFKGKMLGIIEIGDNSDRPYMMKKDNFSLKKGDSWIRKGSRQSRVVREDIDKMFKGRLNFIDTKEIKIGLGDNFEKEQYIKLPVINLDEKPSNIEKKRLEGFLEKLRAYDEGDNKGENIFLDNKNFVEYLSDSKKIRVGKDFLGLPVYYDEKTILEKIKNVSTKLYDEDYYFLLEKKSFKLNFSIYNDTNVFLEDVKIEFKIPKDVFFIAKSIPQKPSYDGLGMKLPSSFIMGYPNVEEENNYYIVTEYFDNIRHKDLTWIFSEDLRCCKVRKYKGNKINIKYKISAKNLETPIEDMLDLKWQ